MLKKACLSIFYMSLTFVVMAGLTSSLSAKTFYDLSAKTLEGDLMTFDRFKDHGILVVNVASRCGFTKQYAGLKELYDRFKSKRFTVLAFPSNQFLRQEPGSAKDIRKFCTDNYKVDFPIFEKADVNGEKRQPVYQFLLSHAPRDMQDDIGWNFTKFLLNRKGEVVARFSSRTDPLDKKVIAKIEEVLDGISSKK